MITLASYCTAVFEFSDHGMDEAASRAVLGNQMSVPRRVIVYELKYDNDEEVWSRGLAI